MPGLASARRDQRHAKDRQGRHRTPTRLRSRCRPRQSVANTDTEVMRRDTVALVILITILVVIVGAILFAWWFVSGIHIG